MEILIEMNEYLHTFNVPVIIIRLLLATLCGGIIGFCRSVKRRGPDLRPIYLYVLARP